MIRILVADDERLEREALQFIAQQMSDIDAEVILATNGREAVDQAARVRPDIAFLDIKMPVMSGIEAARQIRSVHPSVRIVFLTAFDQFDYAQEAIRLHADDFIIKPADNERIIQVIRELAGRRERSANEPAGTDTAELAEAKLIADTVLGNADEPLLRKFLRLDESLAVITMAVVIRVAPESYPEHVSDPQYDRVIRRRILAALRVEAQAEGISLLGSIEQSVLYVLLATPAHRSPQSVALSIEQVVESALTRANEEFRIVAQAGADHPSHGFQGLGLRFANAKIASRSVATESGSEPLSNSDPAAGSRVRRYEPTKSRDTDVRAKLLKAERQLLQSIISGDRDQQGTTAEQLVALLRELDADEEQRQTELGQSIAYLVHATGMYVGRVPELDENEAGTTLTSRLTRAVRQLASHVSRSSETTHHAVRTARHYIEERYAEDLSLEMLASHVRLSPFHLSRIFKTATGTTVLDYITSVRMDHARRLMRSSSLSIKEIAAKVGYHDQNYFSRVFRRLTGTTPTAFRKTWQ